MSLLLRHLEANGSLSPADLEAATRHQRSAGGSLDTALLELGLVTPLQLDEHLKAACGLPGAPVRLLERGPTRPWDHVPKDLVDIGWVIPLAHEGGQIVAAVHPDLPDAKLGALYRQIRGFSPVVAPECCLAKVAAERSGAILSPRYAMLVLDYLQALRDRDAAPDEPAPPAPRPLRGPSDTNPVRPASGKSPAARPASEAPRPLQAVPQDRPASAPDKPAAAGPQDRSPATPAAGPQDRSPATPAADPQDRSPATPAAAAPPRSAADAAAAPPDPQARAGDDAAARPGAPAAPAPQGRPSDGARGPAAVLPATAQQDRPHLSAASAPKDRPREPAPKDSPIAAAAPIRRRSGPAPAPVAPIPTVPASHPPTTQAQRLAAAKAALAGARERDRITEALVRAAVIIAPRVGLFGVKREGLRVLAAPTSALRLTEGLVIPLPEGGPLDRAVSGQTPLNLLTEPSLSFAVGQPLGIPCVFEPVLAGGRTVLMLYLDRAGVAFDPLERATVRDLCETARQSLESLLRLLGWVVPSAPAEAGPGDRSPTRPHLAQGVFIPPVPTNLAPKPSASEPPAEPRTAAPAEPRTAAPTEPRTAAEPAAPTDGPARPAAEPTPRPVRSPYPGTILARSPADLMSPPHPALASDAPAEPAPAEKPATDGAPRPATAEGGVLASLAAELAAPGTAGPDSGDAAGPATDRATLQATTATHATDADAARPAPTEVASDHPTARRTEVSSDNAAARPTADASPGDSITAGRPRGSRGGRGRAVITLVNPIRREEAPPAPSAPPAEEAAPAAATGEARGSDSPLVARFAALAAADDAPTTTPPTAPSQPALAAPQPSTEAPAQPLAEAPEQPLTGAAPAQPTADAPADIPRTLLRPPSQATDAAQPAADRSPAPATDAPADIPHTLVRSQATDAAQPAADIPRTLLRPPSQAADAAQLAADIPRTLLRPPSQAADAAQLAADIPRTLLRPPSQATDAAQLAADILVRPSSQPTDAARTSDAPPTPSQPLVAATIPPLTRPPSQPAAGAAQPSEALVATIPPLTRPPSQPAEAPAATIPPLTRPPSQPLTGAPSSAPSSGTGPIAHALPDLFEGAEPPRAPLADLTPAPTDSAPAPEASLPAAVEPAPAASLPASVTPVPADSTPAPEASLPAAVEPAPAASLPASVAPVPADSTPPPDSHAPSPGAAAVADAPPPAASSPVPGDTITGAAPASPTEPVPADSTTAPAPAGASTTAGAAPTTALHMPHLIAPPGARGAARRRADPPASEPVLVIPKTLRRSTTLTATPHPMARRAERDAAAEPPAPAAEAPAPTLSIPTSLINPRGGRRRGKNEPRPEAPPNLHMPRLVREADAAPPPAAPAAETTRPATAPAAEAPALAAAPAPAPEAMSSPPGPIAQAPETSPPSPAAEAPAAEAPPATTDVEADLALPEHPTTDDEIDAVIEAFLHSPTDWNAGARLRALDARGLARLAARFPGPIDLTNATNFPPPSAHGPLLRACVELGQAIAPHILELFRSPRPQIRFYAAFLFQELRDPRCLRPLGDLAFDPDPDVRLIATRVLESYSRVPDFLAVATRIRAELDNRDRERQLLAAEAAGTLRDTFAVPRLIDLLAVRDNNLREAALEALCSITAKHHGYRAARWRSWYADHGDESRIEWVMDGLRHRDVAVRRWAADELVRITGQRIPFPVEGDKRSREAALRLWQEWWDSNRDEFTRRP